MRRSQFGEDEILERIIGQIGEGTRLFCDIGARLKYSNASYWIEDRGWDADLFEKSGPSADELRRMMPQRVRVHHVEVTPQNVNFLVPKGVQILSIDVDSCDFWIWANLMHRPPVVVVETNPLPGLYVRAYWENGEGYGMSVEAAKWLGEAKGYRFLGVNEVNAFFVRDDIECTVEISPKVHGGAACKPENNVFKGVGCSL